MFCQEDDELVGGHVVKVPDDGNVYLTPLCYSHNHYNYISEYNVLDGNLLLVPDKDLEEED